MKVRGRQEEGKFKCEGKRTSFIYSVIIYGLSNWDSRWLGLMLLLLSLVTQLCPSLCNPMHLAHQAPLSMGFSRQEYWSMLPFPSPGDLPDPGLNPCLLRLLRCSQILYCWAIRETKEITGLFPDQSNLQKLKKWGMNMVSFYLQQLKQTKCDPIAFSSSLHRNCSIV